MCDTPGRLLIGTRPGYAELYAVQHAYTVSPGPVGPGNPGRAGRPVHQVSRVTKAFAWVEDIAAIWVLVNELP